MFRPVTVVQFIADEPGDCQKIVTSGSCSVRLWQLLKMSQTLQNGPRLASEHRLSESGQAV